MMTKEQREAIKTRLAELENANGGRLTPSAVVEDAKDPDSPLHAYFEWDTQTAAQAYWIEQARALITSVHVVQTTEQTSVRTVYYVRDPSAAGTEQGYLSIDTLRTDADMAREAVVAEFSRVADMLRRARELAIALNAADEVDAILRDVVGLRARFTEAPTQQQ